MATSSSRSPQESILSAKMSCQMCQSLCTDPKLLPCSHFYCSSCLRERARKSETITCPQCSQQTTLGEGDIERLPRGVVRSNFKALHSVLSRKVLLNGEAICELCTSPSTSPMAQAQAYCNDCVKHLCSFCEEAHIRLKPYARHVVFKLDDLPEIAEKAYSPTSVAPLKMVCSNHDEELKVFCFDCNKVICRDCMLTDHKKHNCDFIKRAHEMVLNDLKAKKESLEKSYDLLGNKRSEIDEKIQLLQLEGQDASDFVNRSFDIVLQQFEKYRTNLLQSIRNKTGTEARELLTRKRSVESAEKKLHPFLHLLKQNIANASKEEMICAHKRFQRQISENQKLCDENVEASLPQAIPFNIYKTSCARIIGAIGDSLKCADPIMCSVEGEGAKRSEVDKQAKFLVRVNQSNEAPCTAIQNLQVEINSIDEFTPCETSVNILKGSVCEITYTPKVQGQHILKVRVNERPILGNPFHILVKRPLLDVKEPVLIIRGVKKIHDLALHRNGYLIGTQYETGTIVSIDKKGKQMRTLLSGINKPFGVATSKEGWMFASLNKKCCLQKYSKNLELVDTVGCREGTPGNFNHPGRLALSKKGEIYVCDVRNSRIQVFDDDLEYLRWYSIRKPTGVAVDSEGDIYVTENGKNSLCKVFVASKLGTATIREGLANPQGVYIDSDYIYVTEKDSRQITVLDHHGEYVTALGRGVLQEPGGIVGDEDGYLYVCDEKLEAICVF